MTIRPQSLGIGNLSVTHSVLSRKTIEERRRRPIADPKSLVITPLLSKTDPYDYDSIDSPAAINCHR